MAEDETRWREELNEFFAHVTARMEIGEKEYGNRSLSKPLNDLLGEMEEELLDQAAWAFLSWRRARKMRARTESG